MKLHLGCGRDYKEGYENIDISDVVKTDYQFDLERCEHGKKMHYADNSVDEIFCAHTLEHIRNLLPLMEELYRIAKDRCKFFIRVPYAGHNSAFDDPTHCRFFVPESFIYFAQPTFHRTDYHYRGDWQVKEIIILMSAKMRERLASMGMEKPEDLTYAVNHLRNTADELAVMLEAIKPARPSTDPQVMPSIAVSVREEVATDE